MLYQVTNTNLSLNQQVALASNVQSESWDVDSSPVSYLTNHAVDQDVCSCPTNPSTKEGKEHKHADVLNFCVQSESWDVDSSPVRYLTNHAVNQDVCSCPTNPSTREEKEHKHTDVLNFCV